MALRSSAGSVDDVHEQIVERLEPGVDLVGPLVCRIEGTPDADKPPVPLRVLMRADVGDVYEWFKDTVELWQRDEPYSSMDFNHGERIVKYEGTMDLVERVAEALLSERDTSRAASSTCSITASTMSRPTVSFPRSVWSNCSSAEDRLVVVGYFRKQEMQVLVAGECGRASPAPARGAGQAIGQGSASCPRVRRDRDEHGHPNNRDDNPADRGSSTGPVGGRRTAETHPHVPVPDDPDSINIAAVREDRLVMMEECEPSAAGTKGRPGWSTVPQLGAPSTLRRGLRWSARSCTCAGSIGWDRVPIAAKIGIPALAVHAVLNRCRLNRLSHIDGVTGEPARRYEREQPEELIHVDVTKFGNTPDGGGWRFVDKSQGDWNRQVTRDRTGANAAPYKPRVGACSVHTVVDEYSPMVYAEIQDDEKAVAAAGVLHRAVAWFATSWWWRST
jgi:hypothetical protein